jgi:hypothetical protein
MMNLAFDISRSLRGLVGIPIILAFRMRIEANFWLAR